MRAALEQVNVSDANVRVAQSAYLPRLDALWQTNRATANNVFGQLLPQSVIPAISGPVLPSASTQSVWGSAAGALFSWEPFDFGLRAATVRAAETRRCPRARRRGADAARRADTRWAPRSWPWSARSRRSPPPRPTSSAARCSRARRARWPTTSCGRAPRPRAPTPSAPRRRHARIQARQTLVLAQTTLGAGARDHGRPGVRQCGDGCSTPIPPATSADDCRRANIRWRSRARPPSTSPARRRTCSATTDRPRLYLQSSVFARGSGADPDGSLDGGADGLGLERANWAAGVQVVFPNLFDFASLRARRAASAASTRAESARYDEAHC